MLILLTHFSPRPTESDPLNDSDNRQGHTVNLIFLFVCLELKLYIRELILKDSSRNNLKLLVIFTQFNCQLSYLKINSLLDIFFPCFFLILKVWFCLVWLYLCSVAVFWAISVEEGRSPCVLGLGQVFIILISTFCGDERATNGR